MFTLLSLIAGGALAAQPAAAQASVRVDSSREEIVLTAGPFRRAATAPGDPPPQRDDCVRFAWTVSGYLRGFRVELRDRDGKLLPREYLDYAGVADLARREYLYPQVQRLFAASHETAAVMMPRFLGVPIGRGDSLALYVQLRAPHGEAIEGAYVRLVLNYTPRGRWFRPLSIVPMHIDVNFLPGVSTRYDIPAGRSMRRSEFIAPASGYVIALGGHMRDYGKSVSFIDAESGKTLVRLDADRRPDGTLISVSRFIFGFHGDALHIEAGHRYRIEAEYDNPTGHAIPFGGEASLAGPMVPERMKDWPTLNLLDPDLIKDIDAL